LKSHIAAGPAIGSAASPQRDSRTGRASREMVALMVRGAKQVSLSVFPIALRSGSRRAASHRFPFSPGPPPLAAA
jgi:hypothetical protein